MDSLLRVSPNSIWPNLLSKSLPLPADTLNFNFSKLFSFWTVLPLLQNLKEFDLVYSVNQNTTGSFSLHSEIGKINCMFFLDFFWNLLKVCLPEFHFFFLLLERWEWGRQICSPPLTYLSCLLLLFVCLDWLWSGPHNMTDLFITHASM